MRVSIDNTKWWQTAYAALIFFTRLPFWRFYEPPKQCYAHVVEYWPLAGWLTGSAMGATVWIASQHTSATVAVLLALALRMLLTGALHGMVWLISSMVLEEAGTGSAYLK